MKKLFILTLLFATVITSLIIAQPTFAATCSGVETSIIECDGGGDAGIWHILVLVVEIMSIGIGITALIGILIFGIQYLTAGGDVAKTTKAKRRMLEIVIGLVGWVVIFSFSEWLLPGGKFNFTSDITEISLSLNQSSIEVGKTAQSTVEFTPSDTEDKTYSLSTDDADTVSVIGNSVKCRKEGTATITATSVNGKISTTKITCTKPVEPTNNSSNGSDSGSGSYFTPDQISDFNAKWDALENQNYYELKELAMSKGISEDNFIGMVAWARFENYEQSEYGPYFAYLCNSVGLNKALAYSNKGQASGWLNEIEGWGGDYKDARYFGNSTEATPYNGYYGHYKSNLKSIRMALDYPYPNIYGCSGSAFNSQCPGGYIAGSHKSIYDPKGTNGESCNSLIFDGESP